MSVRFALKSSIIHEQFGDETVIVNLDSGCYYSLLGTADAIWTLAASGRTRTQVLEDIRAAFTGDATEIARATDTFLDELVAENLLNIAEDAAAPDAKAPAISGGVFVKPAIQKYTDMEELLQLDPIHQVDEIGWPSAKPSAV